MHVFAIRWWSKVWMNKYWWKNQAEKRWEMAFGNGAGCWLRNSRWLEPFLWWERRLSKLENEKVRVAWAYKFWIMLRMENEKEKMISRNEYEQRTWKNRCSIFWEIEITLSNLLFTLIENWRTPQIQNMRQSDINFSLRLTIQAGILINDECHLQMKERKDEDAKRADGLSEGMEKWFDKTAINDGEKSNAKKNINFIKKVVKRKNAQPWTEVSIDQRDEKLEPWSGGDI